MAIKNYRILEFKMTYKSYQTTKRKLSVLNEEVEKNKINIGKTQKTNQAIVSDIKRVVNFKEYYFNKLTDFGVDWAAMQTKAATSIYIGDYLQFVWQNWSKIGRAHV